MKHNKFTISIAAAFTLAATLNANELDLGQIEVYSATKSNQSIQDITSNVEVITSAELKEKHINSVLDALRYAGVPITQSGSIGQQSSFFMNGFSSGNTLVLIDGIKYNNPTGTESQAQFEHLMINDIEQIEIIKGAQSGIWGANAVAGVINIITKKATNELKVNANIEAGSNDTQKYNATISQKVDKFSYYLGLNYITTDGISAQTPNGDDPDIYEDDGYENRTINIKLGYDITNNDTIELTATDIDATVQYDAWGQPNSSANEVKQKDRLYKVLLTHNFNATDYLNFSYSKTKFDKEDPLGWTTKFEGYNQEFSVDGKYLYADNSFLLAGVGKQESKDEIGDHKLESKGFYITNSNRFDQIILTQSLRYDRYDEFKNKTTGKVGVKYNFSNDVNLSANYGTAYKTPSLYQLYTPFYGNEDLKPETTKGYDITLQYKHIKATYFNNKTKDLIGYDPVTWVNEQVDGISRFKGYEVSYQNEIFNDTLFGFKYKYLNAKDKDGKTLPRRIKDALSVSVDYYGFNNLHLGAFVNYVGSRFDDAALTNQTGKYTLVSAVVNYQVNDNLKAYVKLDNITDRYYQEVDGYATPGRSFYVGLNAKF